MRPRRHRNFSVVPVARYSLFRACTEPDVRTRELGRLRSCLLYTSLLLAVSLLYPLILLESTKYPELLSLFSFMALGNIAGLAPLALFTTAQQQLGRRWWQQFPMVVLMSLLGAGMMLTTARAAWRAFSKRETDFERTAKFGIDPSDRKDWMRLRYQNPIDPIVYGELALAGLNFITSYSAIRVGAWPIALYSLIFAFGLSFTAGSTLTQAFRRRLKLSNSGMLPGPSPAPSAGE